MKLELEGSPRVSVWVSVRWLLVRVKVRFRRTRRRCLRSLDGQTLYKKYLLNVSFDGKRSPISLY